MCVIRCFMAVLFLQLHIRLLCSIKFYLLVCLHTDLYDTLQLHVYVMTLRYYYYYYLL